MATDMANKVIRVGVIGCGELAQVAHLPVLSLLSDFFQITALCDISPSVLKYCGSRFGLSPKLLTSVPELCVLSDVDAVIICSSSAQHTTHAVLALQNDKHVFVEKPLTYHFQDIETLVAAEQKSKGSIFVGYMRRYAPALQSAIEEIGDRSKIRYARFRAIIGQNAPYVKQSGTFPKRFDDISAVDKADITEKDQAMKEQALAEFGVPVTDETMKMLFWLGALATHDISAMRETLGGLPLSVRGAHLKTPIWSAIFEYNGFSATYEAGMISVQDFDAHIEVYTDEKIVQVKYEQPYIKGLPITMKVREKITGRDGQVGYQERIVKETYEDTYTLELKEWHKCISEGRRPKTTIQDASEDLKIIKMLMRAEFVSPRDLL